MKEKFLRFGRAAGKWVGYPLFFLFCFFLFAYWTFPYQRVKEFLVQEVEYPRGPGGIRQASGYKLEIIALSPSWLTGIEATGVSLGTVPEDPTELPAEVTIESLTARIGFFSLLMGTTAVDFEASLAGGTIEGELEMDETTTAVEAVLANVHLRRVGLLRGMLGIPIQGVVSGEVDVMLAEDPEQTNGNIDLRLDDVAIGDGNAKLAIDGVGEITVERLAAGDIHLVGGIEEGVMEITTFQGRGEDVDLDGSGTVRFRRPMAASQVDILLRADIKDSYRDRNERTQAVFSLMDLNPQLRSAKTPDGAIQYRISGTFGGRIRGVPSGRSPPPGRE